MILLSTKGAKFYHEDNTTSKLNIPTMPGNHGLPHWINPHQILMGQVLFSLFYNEETKI